MGENKTEIQEPNCFHAFIDGRVQGVGYRYFAFQSARKLGVTGWVKNLPDGRVEVYGEADEMTLTEFLTDLNRGPVTSVVQKIDISWKTVDPQFPKFTINS